MRDWHPDWLENFLRSVRDWLVEADRLVVDIPLLVYRAAGEPYGPSVLGALIWWQHIQQERGAVAIYCEDVYDQTTDWAELTDPEAWRRVWP